VSQWFYVCSLNLKGVVRNKGVVVVFINLHGIVIDNESEAQPLFHIIRMFGLVR
jgi:hypothetical protein